jgi:hypothetical protein
MIFAPPYDAEVDVDGGEGWEGGQEGQYVAEAVARQKFEVGEMRELSEFIDGETVFGNDQLKDLQG